MSIGMAVGQSNHNTPFLSILQALSGGTFVYLACCDLLIHEFHNSHDDHEDENLEMTEEEMKAKGRATIIMRVLKLFTMMCGGGLVIALIALAPEHSH